MRERISVALLAALAACLLAPSAHAAFGVQERNFEAATCNQHTCTYAQTESELKAGGKSKEAFTHAAGHPPWGTTAFELNSTTGLLGSAPEGELKRIRVDLPPGLAADPQALPQCELASFRAGSCASDTQVGTTELTAYAGGADLSLEGTVYDLVQPKRLPLLFGIEVNAAPPLVSAVRMLMEGHVDWSGDYHEYFEINDIPREAELAGGGKAPMSVLRSKLNFNGRAGSGSFLTLPSSCGPSTTSYLEVESWAGEVQHTETHTPVGVEGCASVPFSPAAAVTPGAAAADEPDGTSVTATVPQHTGAEELNSSDVRNVHLKLPEGLTLNPAAAPELATCSEAQIAIGTTEPVGCPAASQIGTVEIETDLPAHSLAGPVYLGGPASGPVTGPPYTIYLDAESIYGVSVRLRGTVSPDPVTGQLQTSFEGTPQLPFSKVTLQLQGGPRAVLANPLACGASESETTFSSWSGSGALSLAPFETTGCTGAPPFALSQSTGGSTPDAAASTDYSFALTRATGEQYVSRVSTTLPEGLVGLIPSITLCGDAQAASGTCGAASRIGTASVQAGAGPEPVALSGPAYLTGPYDGAPFGLSIPIAAKVGPFDLGTVVTRATVAVQEYTGQVIVTATLPTIVGGVPLRLRTLDLDVDRPGFLVNPTSCAPHATQSTATSTLGATRALETPFTVDGCPSLPFAPRFAAASAAPTSQANGVRLRVTVHQRGGEAAIRDVVTRLPFALPVRLTTLQLACTRATFTSDRAACPKGSRVGIATVDTPVLPFALSGPVYLVARGAQMPALEMILEGHGVRIVLVGSNAFSGGQIVTTFSSLPDVPISSFGVEFPAGPRSLVGSAGNLCASQLTMPTSITGQNGAQRQQATRLAVSGCAVKLIRARVHGRHATLTVRTQTGGSLTVRGRGVRTLRRRVRAAGLHRVTVSLTRRAGALLSRHGAMRVALELAFVPPRYPRGSSRVHARIRFLAR